MDENKNVIELNEDDYREVKSSDEPEAEDFCEVEAADEPESVELEYKPSPSVSAMYAELCRKREESKKLKKGKKHKAHKKKGKKKASHAHDYFVEGACFHVRFQRRLDQVG